MDGLIIDHTELVAMVVQLCAGDAVGRRLSRNGEVA